MKTIKKEHMDQIPGKMIKADDQFTFWCHAERPCFNQCCRNLNLFLYPYDVLLLRKALNISSDQFLERYVDVVMREGNTFPDVLLKMLDEYDQACVFRQANGCRVYDCRPYTCRTFPVEYGLQHSSQKQSPELIGFFRPPDFCKGEAGGHDWTLNTWVLDQNADQHQKMAIRWWEVKSLFSKDPWGAEGAQGKRGKMAFIASYNIDAFRLFVFDSSFLKRTKIKTALIKKLEKDDIELMRFGFEWIKLFIWGIPSKKIRLR